MKKVTRILVSVIALASGAVALSACGQKGPLILPPAPGASAAAQPPASR